MRLRFRRRGVPGAVLLPEEVLLADGGGEQEEQVQEEAGGRVLAVGGAVLRKVMQVKVGGKLLKLKTERNPFLVTLSKRPPLKLSCFERKQKFSRFGHMGYISRMFSSRDLINFYLSNQVRWPPRARPLRPRA